jgi:hypothetical protein
MGFGLTIGYKSSSISVILAEASENFYPIGFTKWIQ